MSSSTLCRALLCFAPVLGFVAGGAFQDPGSAQAPAAAEATERSVRVEYLEIVTPDVEETCATLAKVHGVTFGKPRMELGNARTASLHGGGLIGVRAPMRKDEAPTVRPYLLVDDIDAAVAAAKEGGAEFAMLPTPIPGGGKFAIYLQGGIQHGFWQKQK